MNSDEIIRSLDKFQWNLLSNIHGSAHSSFIGFISTEWIKQSKYNTILDGAPSPNKGEERKGQKNADLLLFKNKTPIFVVEIETLVSKYQDKIDTIVLYLNNKEDFEGLEAGILFMSNYCSGEKKYHHNWNKIKNRVKNMDYNIILISIVKEKSKKENSVFGRLRSRNEYYPWNITKIDYWMHTKNHDIHEGIFWSALI